MATKADVGTRALSLRRLALPLVIVVFTALGLWNLGGPPPWWDEGWTLSVARTIVERGIYARLFDGQPAPHGLEASVPVTELVAASFRLFGVGIGQGRIPIVISAAIALVLLYVLAARAYDRKAAWGALAGTLLLSMHPQLHPLLMGRQVMAEMPLFAVLLAGYLLADLAGRRHWLLAIPAALIWALALTMKAQTLPFWAVSVAAGTILALILRRWRSAGVLAGAGIAAFVLYRPILALLAALANQPFTAPVSQGITEVMAVVFVPFNRLFALRMWYSAGLLVTLGLAYAAWQLLREWRSRSAPADTLVLRAMLLALCLSWLSWFLVLSVGVPRYMFPPIFVGAIFLGALLRDISGGFDLRGTLGRLAGSLRDIRLVRKEFPLWVVALLVALALNITTQTLVRYYVRYSDDSVTRVASFFNASTPPDTRIETYEAELQFLLDRPYTYPPDQMHVELNRRSLLGQTIAIPYDPLVNDPDYLVIGEFTLGNDLYAPAISSGAFRLVERIGIYEVYERVRGEE